MHGAVEGTQTGARDKEAYEWDKEAYELPANPIWSFLRDKKNTASGGWRGIGCSPHRGNKKGRTAAKDKVSMGT